MKKRNYDKEKTAEFMSIMGEVFKALDDREISAEEATVLCSNAALLIDKCRPLLNKWWQRALLDSASSALREASSHFRTMQNGD